MRIMLMVVLLLAKATVVLVVLMVKVAVVLVEDLTAKLRIALLTSLGGWLALRWVETCDCCAKGDERNARVICAGMLASSLLRMITAHPSSITARPCKP